MVPEGGSAVKTRASGLSVTSWLTSRLGVLGKRPGQCQKALALARPKIFATLPCGPSMPMAATQGTLLVIGRKKDTKCTSAGSNEPRLTHDSANTTSSTHAEPNASLSLAASMALLKRVRSS
jgi:hypothetical protein